MFNLLRSAARGLLRGGLLGLIGTLWLMPAGCSRDDSEGRITATEPQPENQKARTREEEVAYLTNMLSSEDDGKVRRAIYWLNEYAADSAGAVPALERVAQSHANEKLKTGAREAIAKIQSATKK